MSYEEVHRETLRLVREEGGMAAIDFYHQNKKVYDRAGFDEHSRDIGLRGKLELIGAVEEKHNFLGVKLQPKKGETLTTADCIDYVIDTLYNSLDLTNRIDEIPLASV